jgi:hypothetical protein
MNYKQIIQRELDVFTKAYPENRKLLKKFANKIKLEIELNEKNTFPNILLK